MKIYESTIKLLATRLNRLKNVDKKKAVVFIGAGCSVSAGIPGCAEMEIDL